MFEDEETLILPELLIEPEETSDAPLAPAEKAIRFFQNKGMSREDAAAFVWNLTQESGKGLQTDLVHDKGTGYGIAGFRDPVPGLGRRTNLFKFAGTQKPSLDQQLEFMWHELNSSENAALRKVQAAQTPETKAQAAISYFRPFAAYAADRARRAGEVLEYVKGIVSGSPVRTAVNESTAPEIPAPVTQQLEEPRYGPELADVQVPIDPLRIQIPEELTPPLTSDPGVLHELAQLRYPVEPMPMLPVPASQELTPNEIAYARMRQSAQPQGGRQEGALTRMIEAGVIPDSPLGAAATAAAMLPGISAPAKLGILATGAALDTFGGEAEAAQRSRQKKSPEQLAQERLERKTKKDQMLVAKTQPLAKEFMQSFGDTNRGGSEWWAGALTLGALTGLAIAAPKVSKMIAARHVPRLRTVADAVPGTVSISRNTDLARTADDLYAGAMAVANRAGLNANAIAEVEKAALQTRAAGHDLVNTAAHFGTVNTLTHKYVSKVPLAQAVKSDSPAVRQYLIYRNQEEELLRRAAKMSKAKQIQYGPPNINGEALPDIVAKRWALEKAHPEVVQAHKEFTELNRALWAYESGGGQFATLSKKKYKELMSQWRSYVPYSKDKPALEQNPYDLLYDAMHNRMVARMEEEMRGRYITAMQGVKLPNGQAYFKPVTDKQLKDNPHWARHVVTYKVNGMPHKVTTDRFLADVLTTDPESISGGLLFRLKQLFEKTTTGKFAPWFADTSAWRTWHQAQLTTPEGFKKPAMIFAKNSMLTAVPQQLYPKIARHYAETLRDGWLENVIGAQNVDNIANMLARVADRSKFAAMQRAGGFEGNPFIYTPDKLKADLHALRGLKQIPAWYDKTLGNMLQAIHNSANFSFTARNWNRAPLPELLQKSRNLTGDPRIHGQLFKDANRRGKIGIEGTNTAGKLAADAYARTMDFGRRNVPWANIIQQSMKRTGQRYWDNPARFVGNVYKYTVAPTAVGYLAAFSFGDDPNGRSYADYAVNGRSELDKLLNVYFPIPGLPAEQGLRIPISQEVSIAAPLTLTALDLLVRGMKTITPQDAQITAATLARAPYFSARQEIMKSFSAYQGVSGSAPVPPIANLILGSQGLSPLYELTSQTYARSSDPHSPNPQVPIYLEMMLRSVGGGIADIAGSTAAGYFASDEEGVGGKLADALTTGLGRVVQKSAMGRNLTPSKQVQSRHTPINDAFFARRKELQTLERFFKSGDTAGKGRGSITGEVFRQSLMGDKPPLELTGKTPDEPTNPLYKMFVARLMDQYRKSAVLDNKMQATGAIGFPDMMAHYSIVDQQVRTMARIQPSEFGSWRARMESEEMKTPRDYLEKNGVDWQDPYAVRSFWERERQDAMRKILFVIDKVEADMSKEAGRPIKLKDLSPYLTAP